MIWAVVLLCVFQLSALLLAAYFLARRLEVLVKSLKGLAHRHANDLQAMNESQMTKLMMTHEKHTENLLSLSNVAMEHIKAKSLEEKLVGDVHKKEYDSRLEYMRDQMAKGEENLRKLNTKPAPALIKDQMTGKLVDLNEYEILG